MLRDALEGYVPRVFSYTGGELPHSAAGSWLRCSRDTDTWITGAVGDSQRKPNERMGNEENDRERVRVRARRRRKRNDGERERDWGEERKEFETRSKKSQRAEYDKPKALDVQSKTPFSF